MEEMNTMIANEVAADVAPVDAADINTEISDTIEASTSQFGLKEGLVLGGLVVGTAATVYTVIDIFKKLKKRHEEKKMTALEAERMANGSDPVDDDDFFEDDEENTAE